MSSVSANRRLDGLPGCTGSFPHQHVGIDIVEAERMPGEALGLCN